MSITRSGVPRRLPGFVVVAGLLVGSACGSTLPRRSATGSLQSGSLGQGQGQDLGQPGTTAAGTIGDATSANNGTSGQATLPGAASTGGQAPSGPQPIATAPPTPGTAEVPGVTATHISIGLEYTSASQNTPGVSGNSALDAQAAEKILVNYLNAHGGVGGRQLSPVYYVSDPNSSASGPQQEQAECATFTQDHHVFAALTLLGGNNLDSCLDQRHVGHIGGVAEAELDAAGFAAHPHFIQPSTLSLSAMVQVYVDGLFRQGFFTATSAGQVVRIGVLHYDESRFTDPVEKVMRSALAAHGLKLSEDIAISTPQSTADAGTVTAQIANAELKFNSARVTHVLSVDVDGVIPYYFMRAAQSQGYMPRYGLNSNDAPAVIEIQKGIASQLAGAMAVGWIPQTDLDPTLAPPDGPSARLCKQILAAGGMKTFPSQIAVETAMALCDDFFLFKAGFEAASALTNVGLVQGVERLGTSYDSAVTGPTRFAPGRHFGAAAYRAIAFATSCSCFRYTSGLQPMS